MLQLILVEFFQTDVNLEITLLVKVMIEYYDGQNGWAESFHRVWKWFSSSSHSNSQLLNRITHFYSRGKSKSLLLPLREVNTNVSVRLIRSSSTTEWWNTVLYFDSDWPFNVSWKDKLMCHILLPLAYCPLVLG